MASSDVAPGARGGAAGGTRPPGLRLLSTLLLGSILAAAAGVVHLVHAPWLRAKMARDTDALVAAALDEARDARDVDLLRTEEVVRAAAEHLTERWRRDLEDLPFELVATDAEAVRALVRAEAEEVGRTSRENARVLASEVRRRSGERMERLATSLKERQEEAGRATAASLAVSSSLLVLGIFTVLLGFHGLLLGRAVVRPVRRIAEGAERLAAGDLSHRLGGGGSREVDELAGSLNRMAASVQAATDEVRGLNEGLERRVREKSAALVRAETLASLGTLAGGVAHEFNNLLGGILGTAEEAAADAPDEPTREALDLIARTARRGCGVTENLLRFARPREPRIEPVDGGAVLRDAAALVEPEASRREVTLRVRGEPPPPFLADPGELHQVFLNLLANAVGFTPPGGSVEATVGRERNDFVLRVRDTGPGIPPDHLSRLFEPFFTTRGSEGTGLGLAVSHGIVRDHGGTITGANGADGGAEFTVRLPLEAARGGTA